MAKPARIAISAGDRLVPRIALRVRLRISDRLQITVDEPLWRTRMRIRQWLHEMLPYA